MRQVSDTVNSILQKNFNRVFTYQKKTLDTRMDAGSASRNIFLPA